MSHEAQATADGALEIVGMQGFSAHTLVDGGSVQMLFMSHGTLMISSLTVTVLLPA